MKENWDRKYKNEIRSLALPKVPCTSSIWLPGHMSRDEDGLHGGMCVREALDRGLIDPNGHHVFVERDKDTASTIAEHLLSLPIWKHTPHLHIGGIHDLILERPIDYAFFDLTAALDWKVAEWLQEHLQHHLATSACLSFTLAYGWRNNKFMYACQERLNYFSEIVGNELEIDDPIFSLYQTLFITTFNEFHFKIKRPIKYQDTINSMILFRLRNLRPRKKSVPFLISELVQKRRTQMNRSAAALKAWETRRKKTAELKAKRSAAARKAWKTRRKQTENEADALLAEKRSNAAKKAWETRRKAVAK